MMQPQQKTCPHFVELLFLISSQQILHRVFCLISSPILDGVNVGFWLIDGGGLSFLDLKTEYKFLAALTRKVSKSKYPQIAQLTSLIWSFLYVQTYLMPRRVSMKVKCLFQSSIYTIKMSHSTLLIISSAVPKYFPTPSFNFLAALMNLSTNFCLIDCRFEVSASKARSFGSMNLQKKGTIKFLEAISKTESKTLVFLLSKTPYSIQCFYLYMAMQVYSSPNLRLQQLIVAKLQQMSGMAEINFVKNREDFNFLLVVGESNSVNATLKSEQNLFRYFYSKL